MHWPSSSLPTACSRAAATCSGGSPCSCPLALWAFERARRAETVRAAHLWGALAAGAVVSVPLSGQLHLALGVLPFVAAYAALRYSRLASLWAWGGVLAAAAAGLIARDRRSSPARQRPKGGRWPRSPSTRRARSTSSAAGASTAPSATSTSAGSCRCSPWWGSCSWPVRRRGLAILLGLAALLPALLALGTNLPLYETLRDVFPPLRYPRVPGRFLPLANLALAALAAVAVAAVVARFEGRRRAAVAAVLLGLVAADLLVFPLRSSEADPGNAAYARLADQGPGRVLELPDLPARQGPVRERLPVLHPAGAAGAADRLRARSRGGVRVHRALQPPRLRRVAARRPRGAGTARDPLVVVHDGLYRQSKTPGAWFAWEGLRDEGLGLVRGRADGLPLGAAGRMARRGRTSPTGPSRCSATAGRTARSSSTRGRSGSMARGAQSSCSSPSPRPR